MTPEQFAYWLQGFVELTQGQTPNPAQWKSICEHLAMVFNKVTPPIQMQTGPAPGTPDPMAGKRWEEILRDYQTQPTWPFSGPMTAIC